MNDAYSHLMVNHMPVVATLLGILLMIIYLGARSKGVLRSGLFLILLGGLFAIPSFLSGEGAEEIVEHYPGAEVSHKLIHEHEELAEGFLWLAIASAVVALLVLIADVRNHKLSKYGYFAALALGIATLVYGARVNNSGGEIRHPEIHAPADDEHHEEGEGEYDDD